MLGRRRETVTGAARTTTAPRGFRVGVTITITITTIRCDLRRSRSRAGAADALTTVDSTLVEDAQAFPLLTGFEREPTARPMNLFADAFKCFSTNGSQVYGPADYGLDRVIKI